ncbi:MAG: hypothetical protein Q7R98_02215 [Candidatus Jorgensenbacteria bacterium]|nr:hypothetical protein [Candidatus Jorgensenbacteria bacterium]
MGVTSKNKNFRKDTKRILLIVAAVLVVAAAAVTIGEFAYESSGDYGFHAVYLRTGDLYFGKLTKHPFGLSQVYLLRVNQGQQETPVSIQQFKKVFWGPEDFITINPSEVVWTTKLDPNGQFMAFLKQNPDLTLPQSALPNSSAPETSTKK